MILKGKVGVHKKSDFDSMNLPKNCTFIDGGSGEKFLKDSTVIIAFNSSVVYETIASNRNLIVPNFNKENKKLKKRLLKVANQKYFANSQNDFNRKLNFYLKSSYKPKIVKYR